MTAVFSWNGTTRKTQLCRHTRYVATRAKTEDCRQMLPVLHETDLAWAAAISSDRMVPRSRPFPPGLPPPASVNAMALVTVVGLSTKRVTRGTRRTGFRGKPQNNLVKALNCRSFRCHAFRQPTAPCERRLSGAEYGQPWHCIIRYIPALTPMVPRTRLRHLLSTHRDHIRLGATSSETRDVWEVALYTMCR